MERQEVASLSICCVMYKLIESIDHLSIRVVHRFRMRNRIIAASPAMLPPKQKSLPRLLSRSSSNWYRRLLTFAANIQVPFRTNHHRIREREREETDKKKVQALTQLSPHELELLQWILLDGDTGLRHALFLQNYSSNAVRFRGVQIKNERTIERRSQIQAGLLNRA